MVIHPQTKIIDLGSSKVLSSTEIQNLATRLARGLLKLNLPAGSRVGLVGVNSADYAIAIVALRMTNLVAVPVNYKLPHDKMLHCLSEVKLILCDSVYNGQLPSGIPFVNFANINRMMINGDSLPEQDPTRVSLILHTSGSTGDPTPIEFTYNDRLENTARDKPNFEYTLRTLSPSPLFHVAGINWLEFNITYGNHIFIVPKYDPELIVNSIEKYKITRLVIVSTSMLALLHKTELLKSANLDSIISVILQSAPISKQSILEIKDQFKNIVDLINIYGFTETGGGRIFVNHPTLPTPLGSVGVTNPIFESKLIDSVLHIKSSTILSNKKHSTEEYYNTNDIFEVDSNGFYYYLGRSDDMFKVNGEKVYPQDIESVLETHPKVASVVAVGVPDEVLGHKPSAFVKLKNSVTVDELVTYARDRLATYQVPRSIWIIDDIPLTENGKVDRTALSNLGKKYANEL